MPDYLPDYKMNSKFKLQKDIAVYVKKNNIFKEAVPLEQKPEDNEITIVKRPS